MSVEIYLMRHGIAEELRPGGTDAERRLTAEGRSKVVEIAKGLERIGVRPDLVLSSPLPRAVETARLVIKTVGSVRKIEILATLGPGYDPRTTLDSLAGHRGASRLLMVGHQPHLGELASLMMTGTPTLASLALKKGGVAAFAADSLPPRAPATLLWFMTPRQLRSLS